MHIKDTLQRDPSTHPLVNQGQARITDRSDDRTWDELRAELSTFVCEGQYQEGLQRILSSFLSNLGHTSQKGAWVSGFYGSGKSHLLKMLCHLWQNTEFPDGTTARELVPSLPADVRALLKELDTQGKRRGGLFAAAGALPSGTSAHVRLTVLGLVLRSAGLPEKYAQARFVMWLTDEGHLHSVQRAVAAAGKVWEAELNNLYVSPVIAKAVLACDTNFATTESDARQMIKAQFPQPTTDVSTEDFLVMLRRVLSQRGKNGRLPCTVIALDEVQQYIGSDVERSSLVSEVAEAVSKELGSSAIIVAAGQSALSDSKDLQRLMDRFTIRVPLSDTDVEAVTRKVLLQKKPSVIAPLRALLDKHAGEISRQLANTRIAETGSDHDTIIDDYPLLPIRRRFWEQCFRQVDLAGTNSQLRSQLRIIHDAVTKIADRPLGAVIPADELYDQLAPEMVNTGVLLREINERIINLARDGSAEGILASRLCGLIFLIGKLPRETGADIGVRATKEHLCDLLVDDVAADNGKLRSAVAAALTRMASDGVLLEVGDEYRLQTREGTEWDRELKNRQTRFSNATADLQLRHDQLLYAEIDRIVRSIKVMQGAAREVRPLAIHRADTPPNVTGESIPVWVRDQWSCAEKDHVAAAQKAGLDSPVVYVFIPKRDADPLREAIINAEAARQTLEYKGAPATPEGEEARRAMDSRRLLAERQRDVLVRQIVANAKVFQGGGSEILQLTLEDRIRSAAEASLVRLFPEFSKADAPATAWEAVKKRSQEGADHLFQPVGHTGAIDQHPVSQQVLATIGAGKVGSEVRKALGGKPFGWPKEAIDATLIALHRSQHLSAVLNGAPVIAGQLDHNKIPKAEFRVERTILTANDRIKIRGVFQAAGVPCKSGEEPAKGGEFVRAMLDLARSAGGDAPLPPSPDVAALEDIGRLTGTEQLAAIRDAASDLETRVASWKERARLAAERVPGWETLQRLAHFAAELPAASDALTELSHIRSQRLLLESSNPVDPVRVKLGGFLRAALGEAHQALASARATAVADLERNETWRAVGETDRAKILTDVGLSLPVPLSAADDLGLMYALDARNLPARRAEVDAVPGRAQRALELAARILEPQVQPVTLDRATLRTSDDVRAWVARQESILLEAVKRGPVLIR
ncbi:MAG: BREX system P-loop protein BrxC [Gemmatimonadaceae bacterium]|nr:BREX system P-loop protein BrxC [Gemmatimonadaceae bacterium]